MPVITIAGNDGISIEKKREMVEKVSKIVSESYDLPIEAITVSHGTSTTSSSSLTLRRPVESGAASSILWQTNFPFS